MPLPKPPRIIVLDAVMQTLLEAELPTLLEQPDLRIRWMRNRYTSIEERPCIAIAFVSDEPTDVREQYMTTSEAQRTLAIDIIADVELPTETEAETDVSDIARIEILSHFVDQPLYALKRGFQDPADSPTPLSRVAHWVEDLGIDDDEDLADENGRLVCRLNVLYRVRSDDPTVLLTNFTE
jgi:hypothetical protein